MKRSMMMIFVVALALSACGEDLPTDSVPSAGDGSGDVGTPNVISETDELTVLDVASALSADDGPVLVSGALIVRPEGVVLCDQLTRSLPPTCAGSSIDIDGIDLTGIELTADRSGTTQWTVAGVTLEGTKQDSVLVDARLASQP